MQRLAYSPSELEQLTDAVQRHDPSVIIDATSMKERLLTTLAQLEENVRDDKASKASGEPVDLDSAMAGMMMVFLEFSQMGQVAPLSLPFDSDERFFDFALIALRPLFGRNGVSRDRIKRHWNLLKTNEGEIRA